ncbi:MAG: TetR/AcrR family transcriptional regulator [Pedobacter sp.]|uniref:TetR/AcrR family transcriptional regulator n=1 Tax=Pedobacter sp. TaxID=1411316 RepID=UPI0033993DF9
MRNKEYTKSKLIDAVGTIIRKYGFTKLGVTRVALEAGVSKVLIYRYFGSFSELVKAYLQENDFLKDYLSEDPDEEDQSLSLREKVYKILAEQFNSFYKHCELEARLVIEISNDKVMFKSIPREEALAGQQGCSGVVSTLLLAGTDYLILAGQEGLKAQDPEADSTRKSDLLQSIGQIVEWPLG